MLPVPYQSNYNTYKLSRLDIKAQRIMRVEVEKVQLLSNTATEEYRYTHYEFSLITVIRLEKKFLIANVASQ